MFTKSHLLTVFIVFSFLFGGGFDSFFGMIRGNDPVQSGETVEYHINVVNHADEDIEDVHVRMYIYDLGEMIVGSNFDVDDHDNAGKFLFWDTEGVEPGDYWVRITISNDDFREVKHRVISIY